MNYYLAKTEPGEYSIDDLAKADEDIWDGVRNPTAVKTLKEMKKGDRVLIYHSVVTPGVVGVVKEAYPDPNEKRSVIPTFKFLSKFDNPISLTEIKQSHKFDDWSLVRIGRLSTMPVPDSFLKYLKDKGIEL